MFSATKRVFCKQWRNTTICALRLQHTTNGSNSQIISSRVPNIDIPEIPLDEYIWQGLDKWHDKTAVVCAETGRSYLYSEVYKKSGALANFLHKLKILEKGDTVAVVLPNVPEYPIVLLGAIRAGLKVTTINPVYTTDEISKQLVNSQTKIVFTLNKLHQPVSQAVIESFPNVKTPIVTINHQGNYSSPLDAIKFDEITDGNHQIQFKLSQSFDDVIILPYSSGTTGLPKGVELTMKNIVSNLHQLHVPEFKLQQNTERHFQDVVPAVLPMFHIFGMVVATFNLLASGCKLVTVPKFSSAMFQHVLEYHRPTFAFLVPPIVMLLLKNPNIRTEHISQIRTIVSGAAPLGAADIEKLREKSNNTVTLLQGYGLTETSPATHQQTTKLENGIKLGGCGYLMANTQAKIVSLDIKDKTLLGPNQSGELYLHGPQVMKGYHNDEEATQNVLDSEGWLRTGDIAHYDEDGHFFITDRLKELIKVKGFQVAPAELEELLRNHPAIEDAAVVGIPHSEFGEVPKAFIVPKQGMKVNASKIYDYVSNKVAKYKRLIGGIVILDSIPKSPSGKILRRELKNMK